MAGTWTKIESSASRKASQATLTLMITKTGKGRLIVSLPNTAVAKCGLENADKADLFFGDGDNAGKLLVAPAVGGEHNVKKLMHAVCIWFDPPGGVALKKSTTQVDYESHPEGGFIIDLPPWALPGSSPHYVNQEPGITLPKPGSLELNGNTLSLGNKTLTLTKSEAIVVGELLSHYGKCLTKRQLLDALYALDPNGVADDKIIDVWIFKLRKKLEERGFDLTIMTHRGNGYELRRPVS